MIKRSKRHERFYIVSHELIDADISPEALGVSVYVLSRPDDWVIRPSQLSKKFNCGKNRMTRILKEIVVAGFARCEKNRGSDGKISSWDWIFSESPHPQNQEVDKQEVDNEPLLNTDTNLTPILPKCVPLAYKKIFLIADDPLCDLYKEFIDHRITLRHPLSQSKFDRFLAGVQTCVDELNVTPLWVITETIDAGWRTCKAEWLRNRIAVNPKSDSIRNKSILESLTDTSWAN